MTKNAEPVARATYLTAAPDKASALRDALLERVGAGLARDGAAGFSTLRSTSDDAKFLVLERWADETAMRAAEQAPLLDDLAVDGLAAPSVPCPTGWRRFL